MSVVSVVAAVACSVALGILYLPVLSDVISWLQPRESGSEGGRDRGGVARLLFLVPAHDEAGHVAACVSSLLGQDYPAGRRRVVVIADNCGDQTAAIALAEGAECLVRDDRSQPGKPRAIAWALERLDAFDEWDACVIVDADTVVEPGFARALADSGPLRGAAAQAYFDVLNPDDSWLTRLGTVLATIRYEMVYPLKSRAGLNCPLTGNGMCIGMDLLRADGWTAFSLTENWELFAQFTAGGIPIRYVGRARLISEEEGTMAGGSTQRKRWLAGRLTVLRRWLPALIRSKAIKPHQKLDAIAELSNPGPVLYGVLSAASASAAATLVKGTLGAALAIAALAALGPLVWMTARSIARQADPRAAVLAFLGLPVYVVWRLITAVGTIATWRAGRWEKTQRTHSGPGSG